MTDYKKVSELLVEYFNDTQEAHCLLCTNHMKNITIRRNSNQGCDGNCNFDKDYTKEDLLALFIKESER